ncbi:hypothetical protein [Billgrantia endophytica]|uniref:hypothetical protein n=1 Tax=Billgrantia endophytica TaxID=2033802 RepID=UPI0013FD2BBF|nr:hypothetical protein [Halomonas endophytica]
MSHQRYTEEFKIEAVKQERGHPIIEVAAPSIICESIREGMNTPVGDPPESSS